MLIGVSYGIVELSIMFVLIVLIFIVQEGTVIVEYSLID
jgi:hypothetical protein